MSRNTIEVLVELRWAANWDASLVREYVHDVNAVIESSVSKLSIAMQPMFGRQEIDEVFSISESHFLNAQRLDWGIELTEPQATRGLAYLVNLAHRDDRATAVLHGLGVRSLARAVELLEVHAEKDRIDLLLVWLDRNEKKHVTVVEAKFSHKVTPGQLADYRKAINQKHHGAEFDYVLLLIDPAQQVRFRGTQRSLWRATSWAKLMIGIEQKLRKEADDQEFRLFRRMIWSKVNGLRQGEKS